MSQVVEFGCPHCGQLYRLSTLQLARYGGQTTNCRKCGQQFMFPELPEVQEAERQPPAETQTESAPPEPPGQQPAAEPQPMPAPPEPRRQPAIQPGDFKSTGPQPRRRDEPAGFADVFLFRRFFAEMLVPVLFWIGLAGCIAGGIYGASIAAKLEGDAAIIAWIDAAILVFLGPLVLRVGCEAILVLFRIHQSLQHRRMDDRE